MATDPAFAATATAEFDRYDEIRDALFNPDLSRVFDRRSFSEGNPGDGTVSTAHGALHRARRRIENSLFRVERLAHEEFVRFPKILSSVLDRLTATTRADLAIVAPRITAIIAAHRAGLDVDSTSDAALEQLVGHVDAFSHGLGPGFLEVADPVAARQRVIASLTAFERDFVRPAWERRVRLLEEAAERGSDEGVPSDVLTVLLEHRLDEALELADESRIVREVATYLQGGTHSSAQTVINALDFLFPLAIEDPTIRDRLREDRPFAARCIHETLRLRPITPRVKRHAEVDTAVAGTPIPRGALVVLDVERANRDRERFGANARTFDPDRQVADEIPRWGLSFGAGPHQCPGRLSAAGLPITSRGPQRHGHLFGLATLLLQEVVRRGVRPDPDRVPIPDTRTDRHHFWTSYPVVFDPPGREG